MVMAECLCVPCVRCLSRQAVVSVDHVAGKEVDEFLPQKRSRLYGITTSYPQCPQGLAFSVFIKETLIFQVSYFFKH